MATQKILAVAVGNDLDLDGVTQSQLSGLRPILQHLVAGLRARFGYELNNQYALDYRQGIPTLRPGKPGTLLAKLKAYLEGPKPDVVFTIASRATIDAVDARRQANRESVPIVFTVISEPASDNNKNLVDGHTMMGNQITGVSTSLVQNVLTFRDLLNEFQDRDGRQFEAHCISQAAFHPAAHASRRQLDYHSHPRLPHRHHDLETVDGSEIAGVIKALNPYAPDRRPCLLVIPSDAMFAFRDVVIAEAHARGIPTFFQQPECVQDVSDPKKSAVAAYGLPPETIGWEAADCVQKVLQNPGDASRLPVRFPRNFEFWVNTTVASRLGLTLTPEGRRLASRIFAPPT